MIFSRGIYVKKVIELLAFIFEQPSYMSQETRKQAPTRRWIF